MTRLHLCQDSSARCIRGCLCRSGRSGIGGVGNLGSGARHQHVNCSIDTRSQLASRSYLALFASSSTGALPATLPRQFRPSIRSFTFAFSPLTSRLSRTHYPLSVQVGVNKKISRLHAPPNTESLLINVDQLSVVCEEELTRSIDKTINKVSYSPT